MAQLHSLPPLPLLLLLLLLQDKPFLKQDKVVLRLSFTLFKNEAATAGATGAKGAAAAGKGWKVIMKATNPGNLLFLLSGYGQDLNSRYSVAVPGKTAVVAPTPETTDAKVVVVPSGLDLLKLSLAGQWGPGKLLETFGIAGGAQLDKLFSATNVSVSCSAPCSAPCLGL
jgi:hypothetical protein